MTSAAAVRHYFAQAPASLAYLFTLLVTWWTLRGANEQVGHRLILAVSTNLHNMRHDPIQVLVASAFWTDGGFPWTMVAGFLTFMVAAERWLGSGRWILLFAAGHIGATVITVTGIAYCIDHELLSVRVAVAADVGASYGFYAVVAAMAFRFTGRTRALWLAILAGWLVLAAWRNQTFTDYGHLTAMLIGITCAGVATWHRARKTLDPGTRRSVLQRPRRVGSLQS